jgi:hypothetical protein
MNLKVTISDAPARVATVTVAKSVHSEKENKEGAGGEMMKEANKNKSERSSHVRLRAGKAADSGAIGESACGPLHRTQGCRCHCTVKRDRFVDGGK